MIPYKEMAVSKHNKKPITKRKPGHPVTRWTPTARAELLEALRDYIDRTNIPILAEFAYKNHIDRTQLYQYEELTHAIKECVTKKEAGLEKLMLSGMPHIASGCIFSLKQLGWKDVQSIEHSGSIDFYHALTAEERKARIEELGKKLATHN